MKYVISTLQTQGNLLGKFENPRDQSLKEKEIAANPLYGPKPVIVGPGRSTTNITKKTKGY